MIVSRLQSPLLLLITFVVLAGCSDSTPPAATMTADMGQDQGNQPEPDLNMDTGQDLASDQGGEDVTPPPDLPMEDLGMPDMAMDQGMPDLEEDITEPELCTLGEVAEADRDRVVLISHPFNEEVGAVGTDLRTMTLTQAGELLDNGVRLDVGFRIERMDFVPSGDVALILGEDGELASVRVRSAQDVSLMDMVQLPSASFGDLHISPDGRRAFVVGSNVAETSGISTIDIGCADDGALGTLTLREDAFFNLRLTQSMALLPGKQEAVLLGGQAVFEPVDDDDVRLIRFEGDRWTEIGAFDIFMDFVTTSKIGRSSDGQQVLLPNSSPFSVEGGHLVVLRVGADSVEEVGRLTDLPDAQEARYMPDGQTILLTQAEPNRVRVLLREGDNVTLQEQAIFAGLCEQMAHVTRGSLEGLVLVPATNPTTEPEVVVLQVTSPGEVQELGRVLLGPAFTDIPHAVAISP